MTNNGFRWLAAALLLLPAAMAAPAAPPPVPAAAGERVDTILEDQRVRGYPSPRLALQRLLAVGDALDEAPVELRRRYYGQVSCLADISARAGLAREARGRLQAMAREGCLPCRAELLVARAHKATDDGDGVGALEYLAEADKLVPGTDERMRFALAYARVFALDAASRPTQAVEEAVAAIEQAERLGSTAARIRLLIMLVGLNADLGYLDRAKELADEAMALAGPLDYAAATSLIWLNRGHIHSLQDDRRQQYRALSAALEITADVPGLEQTEVISRSNLADYYLYRREYHAALEQANRAVALAREVDYERGLAIALANAGIALSRLGELDAGIDTLRESIERARDIDHKVYVVAITRELVKVLEQAGRYREALEAMHSVAAVNAQITREERERAVLEVQERYASERKTREIEWLSAQNRANEAELEARAWRQRLWAVLALALALAATLLVQWLTRSRRLNTHLKRANRNLAAKTVHDPLTGAFNRRHFDQLMRRLAAVPDTTVGLMVLDIDHFKRVNDHHGHEAGDAVLVEVGKRLSMLLREQDAVVRWGGEEFVLVLPGTTAEGLAVLAERVLRAIGGRPVACGGKWLPVTVSVGAVAHPLRPDSPWEDAFRLADAAMYQSKQTGRNRAICIARFDPELGPEDAIADLPSAARAGRLRLARITGPGAEVVVTAG